MITICLKCDHSGQAEESDEVRAARLNQNVVSAFERIFEGISDISESTYVFDAGHSCLYVKFNLDEIDSFDSISSSKIENIIHNLETHLFDKIERLPATTDMKTLGTIVENQQAKEKLQKLRESYDQSPGAKSGTTVETDSTYPGYDDMSDLSDSEDEADSNPFGSPKG